MLCKAMDVIWYILPICFYLMSRDISIYYIGTVLTQHSSLSSLAFYKEVR